MRLIAFVVSAFFVGVGGGLYAHFLGILTVDVFYLNLTFITLSMLVVGGIGSLSGAVVESWLSTVVVEVLRSLEAGVHVGIGSLRVARRVAGNRSRSGHGFDLIFRPSGLTRSREIPWPFATRQTTASAGLPMRHSEIAASHTPAERAAE